VFLAYCAFPLKYFDEIILIITLVYIKKKRKSLMLSDGFLEIPIIRISKEN